MKKQRKQNNQSKPKKEDSAVTLKDLIDPNLMKQLKEQQDHLKAEEEKRKAADEERKREERRLKEKNKSFEELLNESGMNWKEFK
ncbi:YqkE family protein [Neobacillus sp. MM2021_6]|uniref:YqkE family protein n=1 Tax=Bacillaceae TaxID=186817 RepID=UPI001407BD4A|nr:MULTISPECIES: YqkE family protein [Bacillaceae]MBO0960856.1 YqkE family protein [Neobacillus sp. MM2021_6]NHC17020.1 YqkE family protein [Bacillus sp. MM2020_4]